MHLSVFQSDDAVRHDLIHDIFAAGHELGGAISGEHGIGTEKKAYVAELEDPVKLDLMRRIKAAFDPHGILNPGTIFDRERGLTVNGAQALIRTLIGCGVDTCFMNPGTSEMHFVAALDAVPEMHSVLALFEGVATGAADGYGRMADRPAATLLHLGPGLGNGLANLHNARKAHTPIVNIVGDHATYHKQYDAQLESDIETVARNVSSFIRWSAKTGEVGADAAETVAAAFGPPGQVATLILPADISWGEGGEPAAPKSRATPRDRRRRRRFARSPRRCDRASRRVLLVGGTACREQTLGARPLDRRRDRRQALVRDVPGADRTRGRARRRSTASHTSPSSRRCNSKGRATSCSSTPRRPCRSSPIPTRRAGWRPTAARSTRSPGRPTTRWPRSPRWPTRWVRPRTPPRGQQLARPELPTGPLTARGGVRRRSARSCPRARSSPTRATRRGCSRRASTAGAPPHDWLCLTGGAIGQGLPVAVGAAVACPDRRVIALESDGSAMYTMQALVDDGPRGPRRHDDPLQQRLVRRPQHGARSGRRRSGGTEGEGDARHPAARPRLRRVGDAAWACTATRATTAEEFNEQLARALATPGPTLVEAVVPSIV